MAEFKRKFRETCTCSAKRAGLKNVNEVPKITKITLNMGVGEAIGDKGYRARSGRSAEDRWSEACCNQARKSVAGFKDVKVGQSALR